MGRISRRQRQAPVNPGDDHDALFKELFSTFFTAFIDGFLPDVAVFLDGEFELVPMDKELFPDIALGIKHEVDLLMKAKFRGKEAFFLVHVENQANPQPDFPARMYRYFMCLTLKYNLPVYPVVVFSYDAPKRPEPSHYEIVFPNKTVLQFDYTVIQLNRLSWKDYISRPNPVAIALMGKMNVAPEDQVRVKVECTRVLLSLKLDPARTEFIFAWMESYLKLTAEQMKQYEYEMEQFAPEQKEAAMRLMTSYEKKGLEQGLHQGKEAMLALILEQRFSTLPENITVRLDELESHQLDELGKAVFDLTGLADLEEWLSQH
jgi:hypothetical protein